MAPRSTFVSDFVGETNSVPISVSGGRALFVDRAIAVPFSRLTEGPANLHFRPHDAELCDDEAGCLPLLVTNVYRKGGSWRVEGRFAGLAQPIDVDFSSQTDAPEPGRPEEHTSEIQSLMRISYAVFILYTKNKRHTATNFME